MRFRNPLVSTSVQPATFSFSWAGSVIVGTFLSRGVLGRICGHFFNRRWGIVKRNARLAEVPSFDDDNKKQGIFGRLPMRGVSALLAQLLVALGIGGGVADAQTYPSRTITFVVPFPPGGSTSLVGRVMADKLSQLLGQSIIVDNRGGAGGTVGAKSVAKSEPDGYTLMVGYTGTLAIAPSLYRNVGYDPR